VDVTNGSYLTKAEIDGADEMSVPLARKMFSDWAVTLLREQGELRTADFAEHMRMYFDSCDTRGFNLQGRKVMWEKIYRWLMEMQDIFDTGPYIGVLTRTSWESMCCTLTAFRQMCEYLQEYLPSSYEKFNLRAVNNDMCEHFFSCMGFQTVKNWQKKYHAAKVEADKRFAEERGELGYRMPKPRKNTGNAALPSFAQPSSTSAFTRWCRTWRPNPLAANIPHMRKGRGRPLARIFAANPTAACAGTFQGPTSANSPIDPCGISPVGCMCTSARGVLSRVAGLRVLLRSSKRCMQHT